MLGSDCWQGHPHEACRWRENQYLPTTCNDVVLLLTHLILMLT